MEEKVVEEYDSVLGDGYTDDMTAFTHLTEVVIPLYKEFINELEKISPKTEEVRAVHETYIAASNSQQQAILVVIEALYHQDFALVIEANEKLATARAEIRSATTAIEDLAEEYGIKLEKK